MFAPGCPASRSISCRKDMVCFTSLQATRCQPPYIESPYVRCYPCLGTRVTYVSGPYRPFEEGALRSTNKCHATLNRAQRGRSKTCCNGGLTSPAAANFGSVTCLIGA